MIRGRSATAPWSAATSGVLRSAAAVALGKRVGQALDDLKQRQIRIGHIGADQMVAACRIAVQDLLEPVEKFRDPALAEFFGAPKRLVLLVLVIEAHADRMVGVMRLVDEIRDGELYLVRPQPARRVLWREPVLRAEIEQDRRRLADEKVAGPRKGGAKGGFSASLIRRIIARMPSGPRATSTYSAPASSSARRTNSPRPWIVGQ